MIPPDTQYTRVGDSFVGYQVLGDGPIDLVHVTGMTGNIDTQWDLPPFARFLERLASFSRLIMFDRRGSGISDSIALDALPTWETWIEDLTAVLDATGSERAAFLTEQDGGLWGLLFAATHPERTSALLLFNPWVRSLASEDNPGGFTREAIEARMTTWGEIWGTKAASAMGMPSYADDPEAIRALAKFYRSSLAPGAAFAQMRHLADVDARDVLPSVRVPSLVMHRKDWNLIPAPVIRSVAEGIPGAQLVEVPGNDGAPWGSGWERIVDEIEGFLSDVRHGEEPNRILATILFTDIVGSTERAVDVGDKRWKELLSEHDRVARAQIERFRGRFVSTTGDGVVATFDGPGRAIRCAHSIGRALRPAGIQIRAGLHTGEIELREGDDIGGIAVHIAARVMAEAGPGEVVCSRTVKDLVAGSEFTFTDRGVCALKGVPDQWQLHLVNAS